MPRIVECIVDFEHYCKLCKHKDVLDTDEPCTECLEYGGNTESDRPVLFEAVHNSDKTTRSRSKK